MTVSRPGGKLLPWGNCDVILKTLLASSLFVAWTPRVIEGGRDVEAAAVPASPGAPEISLDDAVDAFLAEMLPYAAGGWVRLRHVATSYAQMGQGRGWPPVYPRTLGNKLVARGCTREQMDLRGSDGSRPSVIHFPRSVKRGTRRKA